MSECPSFRSMKTSLTSSFLSLNKVPHYLDFCIIDPDHYLSGLLKIPYFMKLFNYVIPQFCIKLRGYKIVNTNFFCLIYICPKIKNKFLKSTKCDSTGWSASIFIRSYGNGWGWCLFLRNQWKQIEYEFTCCTLNYWGKLTRISTKLFL